MKYLNVLTLAAKYGEFLSKYGPIIDLVQKGIDKRGAFRFSLDGQKKINITVDDASSNEEILANVKAALEAGIVSRF